VNTNTYFYWKSLATPAAESWRFSSKRNRRKDWVGIKTTYHLDPLAMR